MNGEHQNGKRNKLRESYRRRFASISLCLALITIHRNLLSTQQFTYSFYVCCRRNRWKSHSPNMDAFRATSSTCDGYFSYWDYHFQSGVICKVRRKKRAKFSLSLTMVSKWTISTDWLHHRFEILKRNMIFGHFDLQFGVVVTKWLGKAQDVLWTISTISLSVSTLTSIFAQFALYHRKKKHEKKYIWICQRSIHTQTFTYHTNSNNLNSWHPWTRRNQQNILLSLCELNGNAAAVTKSACVQTSVDSIVVYYVWIQTLTLTPSFARTLIIDTQTHAQTHTPYEVESVFLRWRRFIHFDF